MRSEFANLIQKYNTSGPRYTSYPTALLLKPVGKLDRFYRELGMLSDTGKELSLYIHLPFCRSLCWYCGCNKVVTRDSRDADTYLEYLQKDFELTGPHLPVGRAVTQLHLGGGTPTFMSPEQLLRLKLLIQQYFDIQPNAECSVEMDPRHMSKAHVQMLRSIGFNRASIGVQDMNEVVQRAIHRIQPFEMNQQAVEWLRDAGFSSINMDLIYGLPAQTPELFAKTLELVMELDPDRLAVYNYAHLPDHFPSQRLIPDELLPTADQKLEMLGYAIEYLQRHGYEYIGMDHFAKPKDDLTLALKQGTLQRNFQGYSTRRGTETWAFGVSAISQTGPVMWQRYKSLEEYYGAIECGEVPVHKSYTLTSDDTLRKEVIMRLMCGVPLDWHDMDLEFGISTQVYFRHELEKLDDFIEDGLLVCTEHGLIVTEKGRLFLRNIAMVFDAWLPDHTKQSYSKTI
jgi:oxygen-independent coproporphyrinogen III oxidase